jgi:hypothetical protein
MAKSKFFRVAVSGPTIDGRTIDANALVQAAKNYNRDTYAARGNLEHIRGFTGAAPFNSLADVTALKAEEITLDVAGKQEKRMGLFAQIEPTKDLLDLNKAGQKLYTSIELMPDFSKTGEAYMVGLAFTDSPASLGTERLQFTKNATLYGNLVSQPHETADMFDEDAGDKAATDTAAIASGMKQFFADLFAPKTQTPAAAPVQLSTPAAAPVAAPAVPAAPADALAAFTQTMAQGFAKMAEAIEASNTANATAVKGVSDELNAFKAELAQTPASGFTARPVAAGGDGMIKADC